MFSSSRVAHFQKSPDECDDVFFTFLPKKRSVWALHLTYASPGFCGMYFSKELMLFSSSSWPACLASKGILPRYIIETVGEKQTTFGVLPKCSKILNPQREKNSKRMLSFDPGAKIYHTADFLTGTLLNLECHNGENERDPTGTFLMIFPSSFN